MYKSLNVIYWQSHFWIFSAYWCMWSAPFQCPVIEWTYDRHYSISFHRLNTYNNFFCTLPTRFRFPPTDKPYPSLLLSQDSFLAYSSRSALLNFPIAETFSIWRSYRFSSIFSSAILSFFFMAPERPLSIFHVCNCLASCWNFLTWSGTTQVPIISFEVLGSSSIWFSFVSIFSSLSETVTFPIQFNQSPLHCYSLNPAELTFQVHKFFIWYLAFFQKGVAALSAPSEEHLSPYVH